MFCIPEGRGILKNYHYFLLAEGEGEILFSTNKISKIKPDTMFILGTILTNFLHKYKTVLTFQQGGYNSQIGHRMLGNVDHNFVFKVLFVCLHQYFHKDRKKHTDINT